MIVSFIADLKLTPDNEIKIVEFGALQHSGFLGYKLASGGTDMRHDLVYPYIESLGYPVKRFEGVMQPREVAEFFETHRANIIEHNKPAIIMPPNGAYLNQLYMMVHRDHRAVWFHNHEPVFMMAMDNKAVFMGVCGQTMRDAMPDGGFILNDVTEDKRADITDAFQSGDYVIKMPEAAKGIGTMVVRGDQMFDVMHAITNPKARPASPMPISKEWDDWYTPLILWQEKITGKAVAHNGAHYDGTMRAVMTAHLDPASKEIKLEVHDAYWKFPKVAIGEGSLQDTTVSHSPPVAAYHGDFNARAKAAESFALVSAADKQIVWDHLHRVIPKTVRNLLNHDAGEMAHHFLDLEKPDGVLLSVGMMIASMGNYFDGYDTIKSHRHVHYPPNQEPQESGIEFVFPPQLAETMRVIAQADPDAPWARYLRSLHSPRRKHVISPQFYDAVLAHIPRYHDSELQLDLNFDVDVDANALKPAPV
jgi:hypothetical protein